MKRILFVDDEAHVLQALRRMLHTLRDEWEIETAGSGEAALDLMAKAPFDVIVTDMRMPGMDGAALLAQVREKYPQIVRVILSGDSNPENLMRAADCAHQYLSKPCEAATLKASVDQACALKGFLENTSLRRIVTQLHSLPSLPMLYTQIVSELSAPEPSIEKVSHIITRDPSMTAKMLQLVNSSFFSFCSHVTDPLRAVTILGLDRVRSLVLSIHIFSSLQSAVSDRFNVQALWTHNLMVAQYAKLIGQTLGMDKGFLEQAYMAGLLHDIGKVILMANFPDNFDKVYLAGSAAYSEQSQAEMDCFGAKHPEIGAYLLGLWALPSDIVIAVAYHHNPGLVQNPKLSALTCVHAADCLLGDENPSLYQLRTDLDQDYLGRLGLLERIPDWRGRIQKAMEQEGQ